jgi:lipopolysaccharide/colanic/teichoic acid biosynthesis glycosyltransferase
MRRGLDAAVAALGLVVLSPALLLAAAVIRVSLGSPILFRQLRIGRDGRPFTILKFRTMRPERYPGEPDAVRLPLVGRMLRAASVDELPQLVNILVGHMSFIGPRPTLPEQVQHYTARQHGRHAVRPGLTGWAQVNGRNSLPWPERIELDLWYIEHRSALLDLRIVGRTVLRLVRPAGLYGDGGVNPGFPASQPPAAERASSQPRTSTADQD